MQKLILQFIYSLLIRNFLKLFVGVKFQNAYFLIKEKQFIIVANHNSHLDTLTILARSATTSQARDWLCVV